MQDLPEVLLQMKILLIRGTQISEDNVVEIQYFRLILVKKESICSVSNRIKPLDWSTALTFNEEEVVWVRSVAYIYLFADLCGTFINSIDLERQPLQQRAVGALPYDLAALKIY